VRAIRIAALAALAALACAAQAAAAPVLVLHGKRVVVRHEHFSGRTELTPPPLAPAARPRQAAPAP
jgi:hypothetical protein